MTSPPPAAIDAGSQQRERSMLMAGLSDLVLIVIAFAVAIWANSLMIGAEALRGTLLFSLEMVLLILMRRIHRGRTHTFDYGAGKLEQFANLGIGTAMGLGGLWVAGTAAYRWWNPPVQAGLGLYFAATVGVINVAQNAWAFRALSLASRGGDSVIMIGQVRTRLAKLVSSGLVLCALCVNAVFGDSPIGLAAEVLGSAFVALVMLELAVSMWRRAMPSLLDRTLEEAQQEMINRALVDHFEDYDDLVSVKSRISGNTPLVEIVLGFSAHRQIGEIQRIVDKVAATVGNLIPGSRVTVIPVEWHEPS
ncbi:cation diffusion facilitator family transporter [Labrys monachus]|uniref:Divalent metal cation (Fe/Co/Zn/Cd) transporter n=1 Tax=Labrys monachus TaxID=217067 RepID=A0ABU0F985_9HYPH|nr:cation transporter [Labrys monachus]MDQ0391159.1 divalent metal cation (Fe/Co/Zn/Cd) transporter [Labrys monachus]